MFRNGNKLVYYYVYAFGVIITRVWEQLIALVFTQAIVVYNPFKLPVKGRSGDYRTACLSIHVHRRTHLEVRECHRVNQVLFAQLLNQLLHLPNR